MQVNYRIIQAKDFIKAKPTGQPDLEESKITIAQLADILTVGGGNYEVMLDIRESFGNLNEEEVWELVQELGRHRKAFRSKIAILSRPDEQFNRAVFSELCATIIGFSIKAFTDYEQAVTWMESNDEFGGLFE